MKATLTCNLNDKKEKVLYDASLRVEQLSGIINDAIRELRTLEVRESDNKDIFLSKISEIIDFITEDVSNLGFSNIVYRNYD